MLRHTTGFILFSAAAWAGSVSADFFGCHRIHSMSHSLLVFLTAPLRGNGRDERLAVCKELFIACTEVV